MEAGVGLAVARGGSARARNSSGFYRRLVACFVLRRPTASCRGTAALVGAHAQGRTPRAERSNSGAACGTCGSDTWEVRTSRTSGRRRVPWEGAGGSDAEVVGRGVCGARRRGVERGTARRRLARDCVIVPLFECLKLQKFE
jgi:hypothetical protein